MTLLFVDGFDTKDTVTKWIASFLGGALTPAYTVGTRFGAGFCVSLTVDTNINSFRITQPIAPSAHVFVGAAVQAPVRAGLAYSEPFHLLATDSGASWQLSLRQTSTGAVQLWRGDGRIFDGGGPTVPNGIMIATSAIGVMDGNWHYVELGAVIDAATGSAVVKVDGNTVISFAGNTKNTGTSANIDSIAYQTATYVGGNSFGSLALDDLYVCNGLGSVNNTFLGDCRVQTLSPTGAGSSTQFTATGSASNWANVSEVPDNPATYNSSFTTGQRDTYAAAHLLSGTGAVLGLQQVTAALKNDSGSAGLKAAQKSGATVSYGATRSLGTSEVVYTDLFETNPATAVAYTVGDVNALEIGAEVA